jgi:hypothetical protein
VRSSAFLALVVGCYSAHPPAGAPCAPDGTCPAGLVCTAAGTCETTNTAPPDAASLACVPSGPELCGDGIDQDCDGSDPPCPANDTADGAIDVTNGGTFTVDLSAAHADADPGSDALCGSAGGRDVFFKVHIMAPEAYYLDTFDSSFDTVIRVYHGPCNGNATPSSATCHDDQCDTTQTQNVWDLGFGQSCIVVAQKSSAETTGALTLHVERGHRSGQGIDLGTPVTGDTTGAKDQSTGVAGPTCSDAAAPDTGYHFTICPATTNTGTASTCNATTAFASETYILGPDQAQLACGACDATSTATVSGPHMYWIVVDGAAAAAVGAYELDTTIQ